MAIMLSFYAHIRAPDFETLLILVPMRSGVSKCCNIDTNLLSAISSLLVVWDMMCCVLQLVLFLKCWHAHCAKGYKTYLYLRYFDIYLIYILVYESTITSVL